MINLNELLKELKSNKEIEFERLKKEFIKDDVIIEMGNCEKCTVHFDLKVHFRKPAPEIYEVKSTDICARNKMLSVAPVKFVNSAGEPEEAINIMKLGSNQ